MALELCLISAFLPPAWLLRIESWFPTNPHQSDWSKITHPAMDQEIERVFRNLPWLKPGLITITIMLLLGNSWLILRLWRRLQRPAED